MATTRIMPLHIGKGRTESQAISDIIDYVANPQKTDNGKLITSYGCDSRTADAEFLLAKRQYMPLHIGKGRTESRAISDIIDYVANPQKTDNGKLITSYGCDSRTADAEFLLAKRQYIAATGRVRGTDDVIAYTGRNRPPFSPARD